MNGSDTVSRYTETPVTPKEPVAMQGVIKSYDPGSGDGVVLCDTDFKEYDLAPDALEGSVFRMLRQGQRVIFDLDDAGAGHPPAPRLRGRHGHPRLRGHPGHPSAAPTDPPTAAETDMPATTTNEKLQDWVDGLGGASSSPTPIEWCDGSEEEWDRLTTLLVDGGTFTRLDESKRPNSFLALSDPGDVARVEDRTFICSEREVDAGPTNNWRAPAEMKAEMQRPLHGRDAGPHACTWCRSRWARSARPSPTSACSSPTPPTSP